MTTYTHIVMRDDVLAFLLDYTTARTVEDTSLTLHEQELLLVAIDSMQEGLA